MDVFQIIMGIEEEFDIEIDNEEAEKITTVQDAVDQIKKSSGIIWCKDEKAPMGFFVFMERNEGGASTGNSRKCIRN